MSNPSGPEDKANGDRAAEQELPTPQQPEDSAAKKQQHRPSKNQHPRKVYDLLLDSWYYAEVNKRMNEHVGLFKNYQINPYTKKTLDYVTPKITERRTPLPLEKQCPTSVPNCTITDDERKLLDSYKVVKAAMDRSIAVPKQRFCEPQTELMRLGWDDLPPPPRENNACLYIQPPWSSEPCCYFYPRTGVQENENYDERFRAVHQTAEFIRTATKLKQFDAVMNPNGIRKSVMKH